MIFFLIPIYNEEPNIGTLFSELSSILPQEQKYFVFSDDGSKDSSIALLKTHFKEFPHVILGDGTNRGPGYAFNTGFEWILQNSNSEKDCIITLEADCTSDLSVLPKMFTIHKAGYNLVLASVYSQGGGFIKTSFFRKTISFIANTFFRFVFDLKVLTLSSFYRVYSVELVKSIKSKYGTITEEKGFICMLEILLKAIKCNACIIEVPTVLKTNNRKGNSKLKIGKTTYQYLVFLFKKKF